MTIFVIVAPVIHLLYLIADRSVQSSGTGFNMGAAIGSLLILLLGLFILYATVKFILNMSNLRRNGVVIEGGTITDQRSENIGGLRRSRYRGSPALVIYVTYSYEYAGKTYTKEQIVSRQYGANLQPVNDKAWVGKVVSVRLLPQDPDIAYLEGIASIEQAQDNQISMVVGLCFAAICLGTAVYLAVLVFR
jgi:hypothetical protein